MVAAPVQFSEDQAEAFDVVSAVLLDAGIDLDNSTTLPPGGSKPKSRPLLEKLDQEKPCFLQNFTSPWQKPVLRSFRVIMRGAGPKKSAPWQF